MGGSLVAPASDAQGALAGLMRAARDLGDELPLALDLVEREARYRAIVDTSMEGIWVFDPDGGTTFANRCV